jgi:hypothetical protein
VSDSKVHIAGLIKVYWPTKIKLKRIMTTSYPPETSPIKINLNYYLDRFEIALIIKYNNALMRRVSHGYCLRESGAVESWYISMIEEHLGAARGKGSSRPGRNSPISESDIDNSLYLKKRA